MNLHVRICAFSQLTELYSFPLVVQQAVSIQLLLSQVKKMGETTSTFLLFFIRFCSSPVLHQSL